MKSFKYLTILFFTLTVLVACNDNKIIETESTEESKQETIVETQKETIVETQKETLAETQKETLAETKKETLAETKREILAETKKEILAETKKESSEFQWLYDELEGKYFSFSSGAGAWSTDIKFGKNGNFEGYYHDTNMGELEGPTRYENHFSGRMNIVYQDQKYVYSMKLEDYKNLNEKYKNAENDDKLIIKFVDESYGFEGTNSFTLFLPYANISKEKDHFKHWLTGQISDENKIDRFVIKNNSLDYGIVEVIE